MSKSVQKTHCKLDACNDRICGILAKVNASGRYGATLLKDGKAAYAALKTHWKLVQWLAIKKPVAIELQSGSGCYVWTCGLCHVAVATYLTLDVHVCKAVLVPADLVPVVKAHTGHSCELCSQRVTLGRSHACKSLFLCTALYDFGGRVCDEGRLERVTEVAAAAAAVPGLHDNCAQLRRLNARVVAVVDVPGVLADVPDVAAATAAAQQPLVTVAWIAESQMAVSTQGLYLCSGRHLVYWGPRAPSRAQERLAGEGAAAFSDMQWLRRLCADKNVVGSFGGLIVRGFPFGGVAAMVNHKCAPTACVEHVMARRPCAAKHLQGQRGQEKLGQGQPGEGKQLGKPEQRPKKGKQQQQQQQEEELEWEEAPVLLMEVRDEHVGGLVEISYDYQAQTDKRSEAMRCRCTPDCTGWLVKYTVRPSKKKRS
ncbi:hypothetical protein HYH02_014829 [Chlamydomonas schloesseri]|uniref:SET domain-containing protein n=1 Tax=Chlamydomonas schloesseri TaxID=2026947 RepID=A0A835VRD7_9CHLO|nr:hypothetical protein HYH02_014829 [Chlamydomonas schloesseri]|eukprot:KAG2426402.1 hypothetical protein HYH02_014829 [Chlamydomonas schloesseri]